MSLSFKGIGGHNSARARTVEWLTPPEIIAALGPFDLDPCAPAFQPWPTAERVFTKADNGLMQPWGGRVWLNPPYSTGVIDKFMGRMAEHRQGTALIFGRTDTDSFQRHVFGAADAVLFMRGRISFRCGERFWHPETGRWYEIGDVAPGNAGAPTVLIAYGQDDMDVLAACEIAGRFVPLRLPISVVVRAFSEATASKTWREEILAYARQAGGRVSLDELYRHFAGSPRASRNPNFDAKIRQQVQRAPFRRLAPGQYELL